MWRGSNLEEALTDPRNDDKKDGSNWVGVGSVLGVGIGAAVGAIVGNLGNGIWIGAVSESGSAC